MGLGTIPARTNGQTIADTWFNIIRTALGGDLVPRDTSGVVGDQAGSLGSATYAWLYAYLVRVLYKANGNYVTTKAYASLAASYDLIFPAALPAANNNVLGWGTDGQMTSLGVFTGLIVGYGGTSAPAGWLLCDGSAVSRTTYADLFAVIGESFGQGDNSTTFNLPDGRGRFFRGTDSGAGRDPDAASRTAMATGGNSGDNVGSVQGHAFESHRHTYDEHGSAGAASGIVATGTSPAQGSPFTSTPATGTTSTETRPINFGGNFLIKT